MHKGRFHFENSACFFASSDRHMSCNKIYRVHQSQTWIADLISGHSVLSLPFAVRRAINGLPEALDLIRAEHGIMLGTRSSHHVVRSIRSRRARTIKGLTVTDNKLQERSFH